MFDWLLKKTLFKSDNISTQESTSKLVALLAKNINAKTIIETGTFRGFTTIELAKQNPKAQIITFEHDKKILKQTRILFWLSGFKNIELIHGNVLEELPKYNNQPIDFVFLDDCKQNYKQNFETILPLLPRGAIVCAHDTSQIILNSSSAIDFKEYLRKRKDFCVIEVDKELNGLTIAQKE